MKELLLISCGGIQYGVWKDAIMSVKALSALHRIPLSPTCIAGILIDDGKAVTLADLPACIGFEPSVGIGQGSILLMEQDAKVTGFVVSGAIDTQSIPPELLFPLPDYLKTPVFDSCAVHDGVPIPLIRLAALYARVLKTGEEPAVDVLPITVVQPRNVSAIAKIRLFTAGGELYAVSATNIDKKAVKPGPITPLPNTPRYVQGVTFLDGRLLPVIDLSQRIKGRNGVPESVMLIAEIGGDTFGLLVERDEGTMPAKKTAIKSLPKIVQTPWLQSMVVRAGELIPLIDLDMVLSPVAADEKPVWQRYTPGFVFSDHFFKHDVAVVEFSLLGQRYALPKDEVEDVIAFRPCRALPDVPPIVIGVAEHNGEILPVVDLAMMFGRRSITTPAWRMMLVSNGDFRALVITETVSKERRLAPDIHRVVPIHLPHHLMYGCYPDANAVRLILNVAAISVHFEISLIQKFLPALSAEMRMMSTEVEAAPAVASAALSLSAPEALAVPELQQPEAEEVIEPAEVPEMLAAAPAIAHESDPDPDPVEAKFSAVPPENKPESLSSSGEWSEWDADEVFEDEQLIPPTVDVPDEAMEPADTDEQSPGGEYIASESKDWATVSALSAAVMQPQEAQEEDGYVEFTEVLGAGSGASAIASEPVDAVLAAASTASTQEFISDVDELSAAPEVEVFDQEQVPYIAAVSEEIIMPDTMVAAAEPTEFIASLQVPVQQSSGESSKAAEPVDITVQPQVDIMQAPVKNEPKLKVRATAFPSAVQAQESEQAKSGARLATSMSREAELSAAQSGHEERSAGAWKRRIVFGTIAAVLIAVWFYFAWTSDKSSIEKTVKVAELAQTEQAKAQTVPAKTRTELAKEKAAQARAQTQQAKAKNVPQRPAEKLRAPLELAIPANMPVDIDVYVVKEGDTLWSISEHFTGTPFNYPRIAGENRIADPDLIFTGQMIRLIK